MLSPGESSHGSAPSEGPHFYLRAACTEISETFKNLPGTNSHWSCGRESAAIQGAAICLESGEMGGQTQLLAGGTLPPSWHLLIFLVKQVPLAVCRQTGWEASLVTGDPRGQGTAAVTRHQPEESKMS